MKIAKVGNMPLEMEWILHGNPLADKMDTANILRSF
jgi:hypothetical protein